MKTAFVVTMKRWGSLENHNYVAGVFSTEVLAIQCGQSEKHRRYGKYEYFIDKVEIDYISPTNLKYYEEYVDD